MRRAEAGIQVDKFYPPTDWLDNNNKQIDIRKNAENNSIVLLVGHSADFSKYSLLGLFVDTSSGTYDVYIDDVLVGSGVTKNTQYDIDFSTINTSYGSATTPEALVLHKVVIKPTTSGATIYFFRCRKTAGFSTTQEQGILWSHFEIDNIINIEGLNSFSGSPTYQQPILYATTSKGNLLKINGVLNFSFMSTLKLKYLPDIYLSSNVDSVSAFRSPSFVTDGIKRIKFINGVLNSSQGYSLYNRGSLEKIDTKNSKFEIKNFTNFYNGNISLKNLLKNNYEGTLTLQGNSLMNKLQPTKLDVSSAKGLTIIGTYGSSSYPMRGLRGLKVSNEAPFSGSSPQINVSYTGLDRDALVELFQSLPTVTGGQTLSLVGATGNNLTKVGSPTIDENGVASGFSADNYLRLGASTITDITKYYFCIKFKIENLSGAQSILGGYSSSHNFGLILYETGKIRYSFYANSSEKHIESKAYQIGDIVIARAFYSGNNTFVLETSSDDGITWETKTIDVDITTLNTIRTDYPFRLGRAILNNYAWVFNGSIYLNETYIKEGQNYLMKGYITDTDKAIATDKGWGLVLS